MNRAHPSHGRRLDEIRLQDLHVRCTIGLYPEESIRTQALRLQVSLFLDTRAAACSGDLHRTVDYAVLAREMRFILTRARFRLLESAAEALTSYILSRPAMDQPRAAIEAVTLEIVKPEALRGAAIPSIKIHREATAEEIPQPQQGPELIFAAPEAALVRFRIPPESSVRPYLADWHLKAIAPASPGLSVEGRELAAAEVWERPAIEETFFINPSGQERTLLAIAHRYPQGQHRGNPASVHLFQPSAL